ncbi:MAG: alpha-glucosidase C-terminal domain-containing protein [Ignavibacteriaceae bacterium]|nr:alpha-glucosidase C-terminal domain-containing protein [Ignavibacteriaceae bacterium]
MIRWIISILILFSCTAYTQKIYDLIQPINLQQDGATKVLVSDIFYSPSYNVEFSSTPNIEVTYDNKSMEVSLTPKESFSGIELVPFNLGEETYLIPVKLKRSQKYLFTYKPKEGEKEVNLFGQFNSWDRHNLPMKDINGDGILEVEIPLDPGRYEYKFFIDGREVIDFDNPVKVPNGMGDFNSVRIIEEAAKDKMFLHVLGSEKKGKELKLKFYFESIDKSMLVDGKSVIALFDNQKFPDKLIEIKGREIILTAKNEMLSGNHFIRIAVNGHGYNSNIQTVQLHDGIIAGNSGVRTLNDNIIYCIMIDRFNNGDKSNDNPIVHDSLFTPANYQGGDLQGIVNKLEDGYFEKLGINSFWISPIVDNTNKAYREFPPPHRYYTGYHGYWPVSSNKVEEHFGDMKLVNKLVDIAHQKNMKVFWDYVAHHIHEEHWMWKDHRDWFGTFYLPNGRLNLRLWDEYRLTTWFEPYMPSFDFAGSYEALEFMTDNAVWWLKVTGADGFRHDAVKHVPNEFWRLLTRKLKSEIEIPLNKGLYQIGESFGGIELIASYVNNGQLNAQFNFNLYDVAIPTFLDENASFKLLDYQMQKSFQVFGYNNLMGNIMDSHDKIRYMAYADGDLAINDGRAGDFAWNNPPKVDDPKSYDKLELHLAYILTIPGVPIIYYGDEIGMTGASDPDNRRMMKFGDELNEYEKQTLEDVSKLIHIRKDHPALRYGDFLTLQADENIYAYLRSDMNERILTVVNKSSNEQKPEFILPGMYKVSKAKDLISGKEFTIKNSRIDLVINGIGYHILKLE